MKVADIISMISMLSTLLILSIIFSDHTEIKNQVLIDKPCKPVVHEFVDTRDFLKMYKPCNGGWCRK